jgi:DNA-binding transcriptional MocR family regulator
MTLYSRLADEIASQIASGVLRAGERLPSVRRMVAARKVSPATVMQAYRLLEDRGLIATRPRSGYFVAPRSAATFDEPAPLAYSGAPVEVETTDLMFDYLASVKDRSLVPLGTAFISPTLFPLSKLAQSLCSAAKRMDPWRTVDDLPPGNQELRRNIARRYLECGAPVGVDDIVITSGASEAMLICMSTVTRPGDMVAIESPAFYGVMQGVQAMGLRAVEIPVRGRDGLDLDALAAALERHPIKACWFMPTFQCPVGSLMPVEKKQALAELLAKREIPLVEDDSYAELYFGRDRPPPVKAFDTAGLVMHCGTFSKSLAPGYRVGWTAPGRFARAVARNKFLFSVETNVFAQEAIAQFVKHGGYEYHLRRLREALRTQQAAMLRAIARHFPTETRVTRPEGGYFVWVELPQGIDAIALYRECLDSGVSISPGPIFCARRDRFRSYIRLNYGHPWSASIERGVATVGRLVARTLAASAPTGATAG